MMSNEMPLDKEHHVAAKQRPAVCEEILPDDVVLGRGALAISNEGNVRFRALVRERQAEYIATSRRKKKAKIAAAIRSELARRNARFLCKVEWDSTATGQRAENGKEATFVTEAWVEAKERVVMQKIKQSLRERETDDDSETEGITTGTTPTEQRGSSSPLSLKEKKPSSKVEQNVRKFESHVDTTGHDNAGYPRKRHDESHNSAHPSNKKPRAAAAEALRLSDRNPTVAPPLPPTPPDRGIQQQPFPASAQQPYIQQFSHPMSSTGAGADVVTGESSNGSSPLSRSRAGSVVEYYIARKQWLKRERQLLIRRVEKDRELTRQQLHQQEVLLEDMRRVQQSERLQDHAASLLMLGSHHGNSENLSNTLPTSAQWSLPSGQNTQSSHFAVAPPVQLFQNPSRQLLPQTNLDLINQLRRTHEGHGDYRGGAV